jgi:carbamate kinase
VADSQGGIGYMIERMLRNVLKKHHIDKEIVTLVTMTVVDQEDPAFYEPVKRIGKIYDKKQTDKLIREKGWIFKEEIKDIQGWRRVVPSPIPVKIMNEKVIKTLARQGTIVIAAGGGGVPVYIDEKKDIRPAEVVVDKDLASALMAARIEADEFYILTDVDYVYLNYKQTNQQIAEFLNYEDAMRYLEEGQFTEGSMAPKIRACLQFVKQGGKKGVITEATRLENKKYGTKITMDYED